MIKKLFLALSLLTTMVVSAQEGTSSPYSFYGLGEVKFKGTHDVRSMGGLSVAFDSIHLNLLNPALYSKLRRSNFILGGTTTITNLSNSTDLEKAQRTSLDYIAIGFPIGKKFGTSFGLMPYSSVGYKISSQEDIGFTESSNFTGSGGINRVFSGFGYNITKDLSLGIDLQYNFGTIQSQSIVFRNDVLFGSRELNTASIRGFSTNLGLSYKKKLKNNLDVYTGLTYSPESKLSSENQRNIAVISYSQSGNEIVYDALDVNISDDDRVLPTKINLGFGLGLERKWFVGLEYIFQENRKLENSGIQNISIFENSNKIIVGGYFIPKYNSFSSYWDRVNYRAGFRYENSGLILNTKQIKDYGINFGLGLPVGGSFSNINLGFEYGKRGTTSHNLLEENYFSLNIGLSFSDLWFEKRKYD